MITAWVATKLDESSAYTIVIARRFSVTNFAIGISALSFQVLVLYPWHQKLDEDFKQMKQERLEITRNGQKARAGEVKAIKDLLSSSSEQQVDHICYQVSSRQD